jgi:tape measure domain-containing protein
METEVGNLQAKLSLDISSFIANINEGIKMVQVLGVEMQKALGNGFSQGFRTTQQQMKAMQSEVSKVVAKMNEMNATASPNKAATAFASIQQYTSRMGYDLGNFNKTAKLTEQSMYKVSQAASAAARAGYFMADGPQRAAGAAKLLSSNIARIPTLESLAAKEAAKLAAGMTKAATEASSASTSTKKVATEAKAASTATKKVSTEAKASSKNIKDASNSAAGLEKNLRNSASAANKVTGASKTLSSELKRITSGIIISQGFYKLLNIVQDLVSGSVTFMNNMAQAQIAFSFLLTDSSMAAPFIEQLQNFAIKSPLDTTGVMSATRELMAMGFQAKDVISTLQTLSDTASVFTSTEGGMNDMVQSITLAIGQMKAAGTVQGQELRQMYNSGIPIFAILQEKLGLTAEQISRIGELDISSEIAVPKILEGLAERYGGASEAFTKTIPGAASQIKDAFYVLFNEAVKGPYATMTTFFNSVSTRIQELAQIARDSGAGGVFESLVPDPAAQMVIRNIIGSFLELGKALSYVGKIAGAIFAPAFQYIGALLAFILPPITTVINAMAQLAYWVLMNVPGLRQLFAIMAGYVIILAVGRAFMALFSILKIGVLFTWVANQVKVLWVTLRAFGAFMIRNPWVALATILIVALLAIAMSSDKARASLMKLYATLTGGLPKITGDNSLNIGFDPNKILQPVTKKDDTVVDFSSDVGGVADNLDKVKDAATGAGKAIGKAFNQSFDEVFTIDNSKDDLFGMGALADTDLSGLIGDVGDLTAGIGDLTDGLGDLDMGGLSLGDTDFAGLVDGFWQGLIDAFSTDIGLGTILGAIIGGILGGIFGGPGGILIGAKLGALAGAIAGLFWDDLKEQFGMADSEALSIPIGAGIGGLVGGVVSGGNPIGVAIGALVGMMVTTLTSMLWGSLAKALNKPEGDVTNAGIGQATGLAIGAVIGTLIMPGIGTAIGAAIGLLVGGLSGLFWTQLQDAFANPTSNMGNFAQVLLTSIVFPPLAIALDISLIPKNIEKSKTEFAGFQKWLGQVGVELGKFGDWIGKTSDDAGTQLGYFGKSCSDGFTTVKDNASTGWKAVTDWFDGIGPYFEGLWNTVSSSVSGFFSDVGKNIKAGWDDVTKKVKDFFAPVKKGFEDVWKDISKGVSDFFAPIVKVIEDALAGVTKVFTDVQGAVTKVWDDLWSAIFTVGGTVGTTIAKIFELVHDIAVKIWTTITTFISDKWTEISSAVTTKATEIWTTVSTKFQEIWDTVTTKVTGVWTTITDKWTEIVTTVSTKVQEIWDAVSTKFQETWDTVSEKVSGIWTTVSDKFTEVVTTVTTKVQEVKDTVSTKFQEVADVVTTKVTGIWTTVSSWFSSIVSTVTTKVGEVWTTVSNKFQEVWDVVGKKLSGAWSAVSAWFTSMWSTIETKVGDMYDEVADGIGGIYDYFVDWIQDMWNNVFSTFFGWLDKGIDGLREFLGLGESKFKIPVAPVIKAPTAGHAGGGIFGKEHVAKFAEGDKKEAIIPLENNSAMQPFVQAVADGLVSSLAPLFATLNGNNQNSMQPIYVGTLIADERGLKELNRKMQVIQIEEKARRGD